MVGWTTWSERAAAITNSLSLSLSPSLSLSRPSSWNRRVFVEAHDRSCQQTVVSSLQKKKSRPTPTSYELKNIPVSPHNTTQRDSNTNTPHLFVNAAERAPPGAPGVVERSGQPTPPEAAPAPRAVHHALQRVRLAKLARLARVAVARDLVAARVPARLGAHLQSVSTPGPVVVGVSETEKGGDAEGRGVVGVFFFGGGSMLILSIPRVHAGLS